LFVQRFITPEVNSPKLGESSRAMRVTKILLALSLLGVKKFGVRAFNCYDCFTDKNSALEIAETLQGTTYGLIQAICQENHLPSQVISRQHNVGNLTIQIIYETGHGVESCTSAFDIIIKQCVIGKRLCGGEVKLDGRVYEIYEVNTVRAGHGQPSANKNRRSGRGLYVGRSLELIKTSDALNYRRDREENEIGHLSLVQKTTNIPEVMAKRAKKKPKLSVPKPTKPTSSKVEKPTSKTEPSTKTQATPRTTQPSSSKPSPKATPKSQSPKPSPTPSPAPKPQPEQTCQQILAIAEKSSQVAKRRIENNLSGSNGFVGGITQRGIRELVNRTPKSAASCGKIFEANPYPDKKSRVMVRMK
jgi:hypothetical protein